MAGGTAQEDPFRLDDRLIVVSGASRGIGEVLARAFARRGAHLLLAARSEPALQLLRRDIVAQGGRAEFQVADVTDLAQIEALAARAAAIADAAGLKLVAVNNAGVAHTQPALEVSEAAYDQVMAVNLKGSFFACQKFGAQMIPRGYGKIINLSSTWSVGTDAGKSVYCAAKAGISHLSAALAVEWAPHGVRVCALAPTTTLTAPTQRGLEANPERAARLLARIPMGRFEQAEDLVGAAIFLASAASDFYTGQTLFVDGGWSAR